jgi:hypothetical protein
LILLPVEADLNAAHEAGVAIPVETEDVGNRKWSPVTGTPENVVSAHPAPILPPI